MIIAVIVLGPISEQDAIRYLSLYSITISVIVDLIVSIVLAILLKDLLSLYFENLTKKSIISFQ
jgi:hypothetical protein